MGPKSVKNNERNDGEPESKYDSFDPVQFEAKDAETAILLLQSKETRILLSTMKALIKYIRKARDNIKILFDLGILNSILPIVNHEDLFTRRFAAKILAEVVVAPDVTTYFIESDCLSYFMSLLINEKDIFMQEYFSAILAELTKNPYGAALLATYCSDANFLFEIIQSPDPDVKKNAMEILYNLMQDSVGAHKISRSEKLNLPLLYQYFESPYPEIQCLALNTVASIIERNKDEDVQSLFCKTNGLQALLNFVKNDEWNDLHYEALRILNLVAENPVVVNELIDIGSISQILNYMGCAASPKLFTETLRIIVHVTNSLKGRKVLHSYEIVEYLINALQSMQSDVIEISCYGIGRMALYNAAAEEFARRELVKTILDLLKKDDLNWSAKHAASFALQQLLTSDIRNCNIFLNIHGQDYLLQLVKQSIPIETRIIALEVLTIIARYPTLRNILINLDTIDTICSLFELTYSFADELKIACCNLLSALCIEKDGIHCFLKANGPERLYSFITDAYSIPVRNAAVQLIQIISMDLIAASVVIESNYLSYMLNNRSSARVIPSWDTCIEMLFKTHLPVKFAFTGRLSLHDITQNGFYVLRRKICPFPALDDIFRLKLCPLELIYVINFERSLTLSSALQNETTLEDGMHNIPNNNITKESSLPTENMNAWLELKFGQLSCDPDLVEYVEQFKHMLLATEPKDAATAVSIGLTNVQYVCSRAKMLARFVARQMSGFDSESRCIYHQVEIHLKEIRECLGTSVIPLGRLRIGSYLERALLFKAIADRICLPVALVRGEYGISWVEVAIPQLNGSNEERSLNSYSDKSGENQSKIFTTAFSESPDKSDVLSYSNEHEKGKVSMDHRSMIYPIKLMKPNFIVDLMDVPGDLIPVGSPRSKLYCTRKLTCDKRCCH